METFRGEGIQVITLGVQGPQGIPGPQTIGGFPVVITDPQEGDQLVFTAADGGKWINSQP